MNRMSEAHKDMNKVEPQPKQQAQSKQWFRARFSKLVVAVVGWGVTAGLLSLLQNSSIDHRPISISVFCTNLPFLIYHTVRYISSRTSNDLPRRAQYAQLIKGNIFVGWWAWVYAPIEALPNAGSKAGLIPILLLVGLWYLCTAVYVRRRVEKKLSQREIEQAAKQDAGVWPPPPNQP